MSVYDLEKMQNSGFVRCGTYFYQQNMSKSCCENWQYLVNVNEFKISHSQKKVMRRFHRYLNHGDIHGDYDLVDVNEENEDQSTGQIEQAEKQNTENIKQGIIMKVKEVVERVLFS